MRTEYSENIIQWEHILRNKRTQKQRMSCEERGRDGQNSSVICEHRGVPRNSNSQERVMRQLPQSLQRAWGPLTPWLGLLISEKINFSKPSNLYSVHARILESECTIVSLLYNKSLGILYMEALREGRRKVGYIYIAFFPNSWRLHFQDYVDASWKYGFSGTPQTHWAINLRQGLTGLFNTLSRCVLGSWQFSEILFLIIIL